MHASSHLSTKPLVAPLGCHLQTNNIQQGQGTTAQAKFQSIQPDNGIVTTPLTEYSASIPSTLEIPSNLSLEDIDINFLDQVLVKIDVSDITTLRRGNTNKKLKCAEKYQLKFSLYIETLCENPNGLEAFCAFLAYPQATDTSHISFGVIDSTSRKTINHIFELIEHSQDNLKSLSSISIKEIRSVYSFKTKRILPFNLPKLLNIKSLSCEKLSRDLDTSTLENLTHLQIGTIGWDHLILSKSLESLTINSSKSGIMLKQLPNLRTFTCSSCGSFSVHSVLPSLKKLFIHSFNDINTFFINPLDVPALEEFICPPDWQYNPQIRALIQVVQERNPKL